MNTHHAHIQVSEAKAVVLKHTTEVPKSLGQHLRRMLATAGHSWATPEHLVLFGPLARSSRRLPAGLRRWQVGYFALLTAALLAIPAGLMVRAALRSERYVLSAATRQLVGPPVVALDKQLRYDHHAKAFQYNPGAVNGLQPPANSHGDQGLALGGSRYYGVSVAKAAQAGQTVTDAATKLSFSLRPQFAAMDGRHQAGHLVYPFDHGQVVYTLKDNGLKEDVVLTKPTDSLSLRYRLQLPAGLQARLQPDGSVGIYSADPSLFGNISYGSAQDRQAVEKARQTGPKTNLVFSLPAPVITESGANGQASSGRAQFSLDGNTLTVNASNLQNLSYPIAIDPTVVVQSANSFTVGNDEDNNALITAGSVTRSGLMGGSVGTWTATSSFTQPSYGVATAVYNGYMYILSGNIGSGNSTSSVQFAPINASTGAVGPWHYTHNSTDDGTTFVAGFNTGRNNFGAIAYSGYLYVAGGLNTGGSSVLGDVQYARINSDGTIGAWASTSSMNTTRTGFGLEAYKGYMYAYGGCTSVSAGACSGFSKTLEYAPINANGTLGTWTTSANNMTTTRINMGEAIYNGYLYAMGGCVSINLGNCTSLLSSVEYAPINANGTVGTWVATTSFTNARQNFASIAANGYIYIMGGSISLNDVQYAPIYANGALGSWSTTTTFTTARFSLAAATHNGYLYLAGGCSVNTTNCGGGLMNDVQYAKISPAGVVSGYTSTSTFTNARNAPASIAYNGYLYLLGGQGLYNDVQFAPINADGTLGSWQYTYNSASSASFTGGFTTARYQFSALAYNGYMYIFGGNSSGGYLNDVQFAPINFNGTIGTWQYTYNSASSASFTGGFPTARAFTGAFAYNGYVYLLGGIDGSNYYNYVHAAPINADGTLGSWAATNNMLTARYDAAFTIYGSYLYAAGGKNASNVNQNTVEYAPITGNGTVGTWTSTSTFTNARYGLQMSASNSYLYLTGGYDGTTYFSDTQYAVINTDGSVGTWQNGPSFTSGRYDFTSITYRGYVYVAAGWNGTSNLATVQYARINNGGPGTTGSWVTNSTSPVTSRYLSSSIAYNGYLYVMGGFHEEAPTTYTYTGAAQSYTVPAGVTSVGVQLWGAKGGDGCSNTGSGGYGGYVSDVISVTPGETLQVNVGGIGTAGPCSGSSKGGAGGWNGGGQGGGLSGGAGGTNRGAGGGGGASDVRRGGTALANRVIVAGGGGGGSTVASGGGGGDVNGLPGGMVICPGGTCSATSGGGGGQTSGGVAGTPGGTSGSLGLGGIGGSETASLMTVTGGGGGGGGYYGGGGGGYSDSNGDNSGRGGGGGSGYSSGSSAYMLAGYNSGGGQVVITVSSILNDVQYAPINSNGSLGAWQTTTSMPKAAYALAATQYNGYLYVTGGYNKGYIANAYYAKINSDGTIGSWNPVTSLPTAVAGLCMVANNGYMYILGGHDSANYNTVYYSKISTDGTLGAWTPTTSFTTARDEFGATAYNGFMYIVGGEAGSNYFGDVQYAPINADGTLGAWKYTNHLNGSRYDFGFAAYDGYMYVISGADATYYYSDIQIAPINANGSLGSWQTNPNYITTSREGTAASLYNGYIYIEGGVNVSNVTISDVQYAPLNSIPRIAHYSRLIDLKSTINGNTGSDPQITRYRLAGTSNPSVLGPSNLGVCTAGATKANPVFGSSTCTGMVPLGTDLSNKSFGRYAFVYITLDDSRSATFPDATQSSLSELDVYFRASPDRRMRGGKTSTDMGAGQTVNGIPLLQQLDTNGTF